MENINGPLIEDDYPELPPNPIKEKFGNGDIRYFKTHIFGRTFPLLHFASSESQIYATK